MSGFDDILKQVGGYYGAKVTARGPTAAGVDWNSEDSQKLRFTQLLKVVNTDGPFSLNDYGCGYGALYEFLKPREVDYRGFDIAPEMIAHARALYPNARFTLDEKSLERADYTVASGIFNVKLQNDPAAWRDYVLHTIDRLAELSQRGFAFNMLTSYSDADKMRPDLYYGDPSFFFDYLKRHHSRHVALLHDYGLYEFTLLCRS